MLSYREKSFPQYIIMIQCPLPYEVHVNSSLGQFYFSSLIFMWFGYVRQQLFLLKALLLLIGTREASTGVISSAEGLIHLLKT